MWSIISRISITLSSNRRNISLAETQFSSPTILVSPLWLINQLSRLFTSRVPTQVYLSLSISKTTLQHFLKKESNSVASFANTYFQFFTFTIIPYTGNAYVCIKLVSSLSRNDIFVQKRRCRCLMSSSVSISP